MSTHCYYVCISLGHIGNALIRTYGHTYSCCTNYKPVILHAIIQDARGQGTTIPASRMGMMTSCIMKLNWLIKTENLQPLMGQKLIPLCSTQYKLLFSTTRIPGKTMGKELRMCVQHLYTVIIDHCSLYCIIVGYLCGLKLL